MEATTVFFFILSSFPLTFKLPIELCSSFLLFLTDCHQTLEYPRVFTLQ